MIHSRSGIAAARFLPQSDPVLQRNTKPSCTLKLQTFVQGLKTATSKPAYARLHPCLRGKHSVDGNKPSCGKGKEIVRLCARSLYSARALCAASLSLSVSAVCFLKFQECGPFQCVVAWTDHRLYPVSISGCDYTFRNGRFNVQVCLHHSSSAIRVAQNSKKQQALWVKLDVGPIAGVKKQSWLNIKHLAGPSRVLWVRLTPPQWIGEMICYSQKSPGCAPRSWTSWIWRAASHFRVLCLGNLVVCVFVIHWCLELFWDLCELYRSFWNIISPISLVGLWPHACFAVRYLLS